MKTNTIITIGRQYGSAGRQIGRVLAEELGIKCYDKELLERAAKESGLCEELFENHDEKPVVARIMHWQILITVSAYFSTRICRRVFEELQKFMI